MPIQIINSAVKYAPEPNTSSVVVCRTEGGVVCRVSANPPSRHRTKHVSQQGVKNASDGASGDSKGGGVVDRHTDGVDGLNGEGGQASSPYDMTSVFGLKVGCCLIPRTNYHGFSYTVGAELFTALCDFVIWHILTAA